MTDISKEALDELLRQAKEVAWDEGYDEAEHEPTYRHNPVNPYRKEGKE